MTPEVGGYCLDPIAPFGVMWAGAGVPATTESSHIGTSCQAPGTKTGKTKRILKFCFGERGACTPEMVGAECRQLIRHCITATNRCMVDDGGGMALAEAYLPSGGGWRSWKMEYIDSARIHHRNCGREDVSMRR